MTIPWDDKIFDNYLRMSDKDKVYILGLVIAYSGINFEEKRKEIINIIHRSFPEMAQSLK